MEHSSLRHPIRDSGWWQAYASRRYAILFYAVLLMLIVMPMAGAFGFPRVVIQWMLFGCLIAAIMPNTNRRNFGSVLVVVVIAGIALYVTDIVGPSMSFDSSLGLFAVLGLIGAACAMRFAVGAEQVSTETVYAALSTYLLVGLFFGMIYWSLERRFPQSFSGPGEMTETAAVYYSFVTLSTLGYGDITPRSEIARGIAVFEVIGGQLFLAVMIARLISVFGTKRSDG
jgi:hypothetical protein